MPIRDACSLVGDWVHLFKRTYHCHALSKQSCTVTQNRKKADINQNSSCKVCIFGIHNMKVHSSVHSKLVQLLPYIVHSPSTVQVKLTNRRTYNFALFKKERAVYFMLQFVGLQFDQSTPKSYFFEVLYHQKHI